jgi:hypothetical protein
MPDQGRHEVALATSAKAGSPGQGRLPARRVLPENGDAASASVQQFAAEPANGYRRLLLPGIGVYGEMSWNETVFQ